MGQMCNSMILGYYFYSKYAKIDLNSAIWINSDYPKSPIIYWINLN